MDGDYEVMPKSFVNGSGLGISGTNVGYEGATNSLTYQNESEYPRGYPTPYFSTPDRDQNDSRNSGFQSQIPPRNMVGLANTKLGTTSRSFDAGFPRDQLVHERLQNPSMQTDPNSLPNPMEDIIALVNAGHFVGRHKEEPNQEMY